MSPARRYGRFQQDLVRLGVRRGGVLLVHSSVKSLGDPRLELSALADAMLDVLGPEGTLLMPALSYERVTPANPHFDLRFTLSNVGALPEAFRTKPGVLRSVHPTHSVCALGKQAERILSRHHLDRTPVGENSPFALLPHYYGQILMLGCGLNPNTSMHGVEELVVPDYLFNPEIEYQITLTNGNTVAQTYRPHNFNGWAQRYDRLGALDELAIRQGKVLAANCHLLEADAMWAVAEKHLRADGHAFVERVAPA